jgi:hypothetical protein
VPPYSSEANIFLKLSNPIFSAGDNPAVVYIVSIKVFKSFWSMDVSDKFVYLFISTKQFQNWLSITHFVAFRLQRNKSWNHHLFWTCFIIYFLIFKVITRLIRYIHRPEGFEHFNRYNVHDRWKNKKCSAFLGNVDIFSVVYIVYSFSLFSLVLRFVRCMD